MINRVNTPSGHALLLEDPEHGRRVDGEAAFGLAMHVRGGDVAALAVGVVAQKKTTGFSRSLGPRFGQHLIQLVAREDHRASTCVRRQRAQ